MESMCGVPEGVEPENHTAPFLMDAEMGSSIEALGSKITYCRLLELAVDNDVEGFKQYVEFYPDAIDEAGLWYGRQEGGRGMVLECRTPLMVAALYGSLDVMKVILSLSEADVNCSCGPDKNTALHLAAFGGSISAVEVVKLLLAKGSDPNLPNLKGNRPFDVINVSRRLPQLRAVLEGLLSYHGCVDKKDLQISIDGLKVEVHVLDVSKSKPLSSTLEAPSSPLAMKCDDTNGRPEKKEYPVDPSFPDIKDSVYGTDEFRMYSFKVRPCSRAYSHDWTECPFVHPGENARRRDPRKFHYSCLPCPEFRKGSCKRGDMCEYAHGVFECWLHPTQYKTRLCKDGTFCSRRVCFFAHNPEELRPLYPSTGSVVLSPRSVASAVAAMDMAAALNIFPGSPSGAAGMSPSPFTPPMSPSGNGMPYSPSAWQQPNIPTLHLPGSNIHANNLQTSRLRSSLNVRDFPVEEFSILQTLDLEQRHSLNDMFCFSQPQFNSPCGNLSARSKTMTPSNLDELFSVEVSSPRYSDQLGSSSVFSPSRKSAVLNNFQQQRIVSPINTKVFSTKPIDRPFLQQPSFGLPSAGILSPRAIDPWSPLNAQLSALTLHEKQQQMRSLSARDLGAHLPQDLILNSSVMHDSPLGSWSKWESPKGGPDWPINADELCQLKRSYTLGHRGEEPDPSWVQSLVKDSPFETKEVSSTKVCVDGLNPNSQVHSGHSAWGMA